MRCQVNFNHLQTTRLQADRLEFQKAPGNRLERLGSLAPVGLFFLARIAAKLDLGQFFLRNLAGGAGRHFFVAADLERGRLATGSTILNDPNSLGFLGIAYPDAKTAQIFIENANLKLARLRHNLGDSRSREFHWNSPFWKHLGSTAATAIGLARPSQSEGIYTFS